jgi:hypothetical protein
VESARDLAKVKFGQLAKGDDPAKKPDTRRKTTVAALCDWHLEKAKAGPILGRRNRPIKASTLAMDKSRIETHIKPLLGKTLVHTLKIADIEGMQSDIVAWKTAKPRGEGRGGVPTGGPKFRSAIQLRFGLRARNDSRGLGIEQLHLLRHDVEALGRSGPASEGAVEQLRAAGNSRHQDRFRPQRFNRHDAQVDRHAPATSLAYMSSGRIPRMTGLSQCDV